MMRRVIFGMRCAYGFLVAAAFLLFVVSSVMRVIRESEIADTHCAVIHEPKSGCPSGFSKESSPRFTEKNGSKEFACVAADKPNCIDVLRPGEKVEIPVQIEFKDDVTPRPRT